MACVPDIFGLYVLAMIHSLIFDLDGTLSDPLEGIGRSINYALTHFGYEPQEISEIGKYIGPPIDETFRAITGNSSKINELVTKYRERYADVGYSENVLYPGIAEALLSLSDTNVSMGICTSKRKDFAEKILTMHGIAHHFCFISGGNTGIQKWQQIEWLLEKDTVRDSSIMVGDRAVDIIAAHKNGLQAAGTLWGYGSYKELSNEDPKYIFSSPVDLAKLENKIELTSTTPHLHESCDG